MRKDMLAICVCGIITWLCGLSGVVGWVIGFLIVEIVNLANK